MNKDLHNVLPLRTRADVGAVDAKKRTVAVVWSVGAPVLRSNWLDGQFFEELSMDPKHVRMERLTSGRAPFLADHNAWDVSRVLGVVESAKIEKGQGTAVVRFASEGIDPEVDQVFRKITDGIIRNVSVGYRTFAVEKIEGVDNKVPTLRAVDWEPYEISAVAAGADAAAGFRSNQTMETNVLEIRSSVHNGSTKTMTTETDVDRAVRIERERAHGIRSAVRAARLGDEFAERLYAGGVSLSQARDQILTELEKRSEKTEIQNAHTPITGGETADEKFARGVVSALMERTNPGLVRSARAAHVPGFEKLDDGGEFRGLSVSEIAQRSLERKGVRTFGKSRKDVIGIAFSRASGPFAGTADFPILLENLMGKTLLGAYATTPDLWTKLCKVETVPDFRASPRYRTGSLAVLDTVPENSEYQNTAIPDGSKVSISTETKGNIIAISRQALVNDDLSVFSDLSARMGRAAKLSVEAELFNLLTQNSGLGPTVGANPFFHSSNANVGAGSALTVAGLDADRVVMMGQKDSSGNELLDLRPALLLVPAGLGGTARVLNQSQFDPDAANKLQLPNKVAGLFRETLDTARLTGTRRYMFADPAIVAAFVVAFLEGQGDGPVIENETGWRVDGTEMKVRFDFKVQAFDPKGAVTNAGV